jgi:hypothetical protein
MLYDYDYHCTHCDHKLNEGRDVHFLVGFEGEKKYPIKLSKIPGVFGHKSDHTISIKDGDKVNFHCTKCKRNLTSDSRPAFVEIILRVSKAIDYQLFISPICGERASYILLDGELASYGNNFFTVLIDNPKSKTG